VKVLLVNESDVQGGAARAAIRLHEALISHGMDSQMLVQNKGSIDNTIIGPTSKFQNLIRRINIAIEQVPKRIYKRHTKTFFSPSWSPFNNIVKTINNINPDIVHLHWINFGMIKIEKLAKIKAPIIWSLHDMWVFTGGCHYDENCGLYKDSCGNCKVLGSVKRNDLSKKVWKRKHDTFFKIHNLTIIGLSSWMKNCAKKSSLLKDSKIIEIPNTIDTNIFKPHDINIARNLWNLPTDKKLILFGAGSATSDPRKGFKELSEALIKLKVKNTEFVVFGSNGQNTTRDLGLKTHYLGQIRSEEDLASLYSAAHVMIVPSLQENLSNVILESLSCGTPVVGFNIGGNSDMIEHKKTGYLVKPFDMSDLADGLEWIINSEDYDELCKHSREKVLNEFDYKVVTKKYVKLYFETLNMNVSNHNLD
jgi:glycosyltransferase involved in cell wall biosynthesis